MVGSGEQCPHNTEKNGKEVELSVSLLDTVSLFVVSLVWNEFSFSFPFGH